MSHKETQQNIKYPFPITQQILWGEMDAFNHVNNVIYFRYFETGRVHFMYETHIWQLFLEEGVHIVVAKLDCNFIQPLIYPNEIEIAVGIKAVGNTSFTVHQKVTSASKGLCAHGEAIIVGTDRETGLKKPWSDKIREEFAKWK